MNIFLIGQPNVGKSSIYNILTKKNSNIVHSTEGTTRDWHYGPLNEINGINCLNPQGAFYVFPDISFYFGKSDGNKQINNANDLCMYLLNYAHVACVSGEAFGNPECIRISYAASDEKIIEAISRIKTQLAKLS
mgnify:CR=1 FL=1